MKDLDYYLEIIENDGGTLPIFNYCVIQLLQKILMRLESIDEGIWENKWDNK